MYVEIRIREKNHQTPPLKIKVIFLEAKAVGCLFDCMLRIRLKISTVRIGLQFSGKLSFDSGQVLKYLLL